MKVEGAYKIEQIFKKAAGLRLPKNRVKEVEEKIDAKLYDMLLVAQENTGYNGRDVIWLSDMPLTNAIKRSVSEFEKIEEELELKPILQRLAIHPPLRYEMEVALEKRLPEIAGVLIYILAKITAEFSPNDNTASEDELKRAFRVLDMTV